MRQLMSGISVETSGKGLYEISGDVKAWVKDQPITTGLLTMYIQHTSASLTIQENADKEVVLDLNDFFTKLVPEDNSLYRHTYEGPDDMPAHIRAALTQTQMSVPVIDGELALGTWQGIFLFEHRIEPKKRDVILHLLGE
ncbi:MAG: secondary thiamine-phosphate synthase enzyme YjbQ [Candidatus Poribacteria bacterium]|nr:secondary thiamine-phosphate synthase enzyme YjbQ [Candidatus Poribacteria bacterium]